MKKSSFLNIIHFLPKVLLGSKLNILTQVREALEDDPSTSNKEG